MQGMDSSTLVKDLFAELPVLKGTLARGVSRRVFDTLCDDMTNALASHRLDVINQGQLVRVVADRLELLRHLADDGTVSKMLEHAEAALVEAVMKTPDVVNFDAARRDFLAEEQDNGGRDSRSGTEFANSNTNSNTEAKPEPETRRNKVETEITNS